MSFLQKLEFAARDARWIRKIVLVTVGFAGGVGVLWYGSIRDWDVVKFLVAFPAVLGWQLRTLFFVALVALIPSAFARLAGWRFGRTWIISFCVMVLAAVVAIAFGLPHPRISPPELEIASVWLYLAFEVLIAALGFAFRFRIHVPTLERRPGDDGMAFLPKKIDTSKRAGKNLVVCIDGTWNYPDKIVDGVIVNTNVYKLWSMLKGEEQSVSPTDTSADRYKVELSDSGREEQVALYYNGVGNRLEHTNLGIVVGGAFGLGARRIRNRAYVDLVRRYKAGDRLYIFGFSRGAAIARSLASLLHERGIPVLMATLSVFNRPIRLWSRYAGGKDAPSKGGEPPEVEVLGCWDTVAAFGIPRNILGIPFQKINLFKNFTVSRAVKKAYHMVAIDERRDAFQPTLMDPQPDRIEERWFPGVHTNVGGGYALSGLSDHTLEFLLGRIKKSGILLGDSARLQPNIYEEIPRQDSLLYGDEPRVLPVDAEVDGSAKRRTEKESLLYAPEALVLLASHREKLMNDVEQIERSTIQWRP
jgi:hypothetical protein